MTAREAAQEYADLGYDTLPLPSGAKAPRVKRWQRRAPSAMWADAPDDSNVGIRCGGALSVGVLDADNKHNPQSSTNVEQWLAGLGIVARDGECPTIETPNNGRHYYVTLTGVLPGNYHMLTTDIGTGEFRHGCGAQVAAPPSVVNGREYRLVAGDFRQLPTLAASDVLPILANQEPEPKRTRIPRKAWGVLTGNQSVIGKYPSRSEAEQAAIVALVNAGHEFDDVLRLFTTYPGAGKFAEMYAVKPNRAVGWLKHSYAEARHWANTHQSRGRTDAEGVIAWAQAKPWPGRTGATDRATLIAHATIAARAGRLTYGASSRDLADIAGLSNWTTTAATRRLLNAGLVSLVSPAAATLANVYRLRGQNCTLPNYSAVRECANLSAGHDVFRHGNGIGRAGAAVWRVLQDGPLTAAEVAERVGCHVRTARRTLAHMAHIVDRMTGEIVGMVERDGDAWHAVDGVSLDDVAHVLGTAGIGVRQRERHAREQKIHRRSLELGRQKA